MKIINELKIIYGKIKNDIDTKKMIDNLDRKTLIEFYNADIIFIKHMLDTFLNIKKEYFNIICIKSIKKHIKYMKWEYKAIEKIKQKEKKMSDKIKI